MFYKIVLIAFSIFFLSWVAVYATSVNKLAIQSEDTVPTLFIPVTILKEGTLYVDHYYNLITNSYPHPDDKSFEKGLTPFYLKKVGEHYISAFPIITGLLAIPVYALPLLINMTISLQNLALLGHIAGALIVAFAGGFLYLLLKNQFSLDEKRAQLLTAAYLFGTINFALISQALWQHGTVQLFLILTLMFLYKKQWFWTFFMFSLALLSRPTAAIVFPFIMLLALYIRFKDQTSEKFPPIKDLLHFLLITVAGFIPAALFFLWYNGAFYVDISNQGYTGQIFTGWLSRFPEGFLGLWLSPSKGILVYSPVMIFSVFGAYLALAKGNWRKNVQYVFLALAVLVHTLVLGLWKHWYGGWSFGYRMASDILPFLVILMVPFVTSTYFQRFKKVFFILLIISVLVEVYGMVFFDGIWHSAYDKGFVNTSWLWSVRDSELLFNIRRVMVKLGVLEKACPQCMPN